MIHIKNVLERATPLGAAATLLLAAAVPALSFTRSANAAPLTNRGLMVTSTVPSDELTAPDGTTYTNLDPGDPRNGAEVGHTYTFTVGTSQSLEGFTIEYCEAAFDFVGAGNCAAANLLTAFTAANWDGGEVTVTNTTQTASETFDVDDNGEANFLTLTTTDAALPATAGDVLTIDFPADATYFFVNPDDAYRTGPTNGTYFAHIETFATTANATAAFAAADPTEVDDGTVTNNVTTAIGIYTRVQETLNFSVEPDGHVGDAQAGEPTPDNANSTCDPLTEVGRLTLGDSNNALSSQYAYDAHSYFRLATNSSNGVSVYYSGDTLKNASGTLDINSISDAGAVSAPGTEQFGLGIDSGATGHSLVAPFAAEAPYNAANGEAGENGDVGAPAASFAFDVNSLTAPVPIATSPGIVECSTGAVRYVANIAPETPAGIYQTQINYIASPRY